MNRATQRSVTRRRWCSSVQLVSAAALAGWFASTAMAQSAPTISFSKIVDPTSQIKPLGNRPAMHQGTVAFYGYRGDFYGDDELIAVAPANGNGPVSVLAGEGDPRPDEPGSVFDHFGNPSIRSGDVVFLGGEFGTLGSTYIASLSEPYALYDGAAISNPFFGPLGVTSPATPQGISFRDNGGVLHFMGQVHDPIPCGAGTFGLNNVPGLRHVSQGGDSIVWPTYVNTSEYEGNAIVGYDALSGQLFCIASGLDTIPVFGGPFDFFFKADTDGETVAFIGMDPTLGFGRHEGVYVRDVSGGPIMLIADSQSVAPGGGGYGGFENVSIDGNLVIFEACAGGAGGCARYGFFGCYVEDGVAGEVFEIVTTADTLDGRTMTDLTMSVTGRDGHAFAFDVRHSANSASLYVATIAGLTDCPADFNGDGTVNSGDVLAFLNAWNAQQPSGDFDGNGLFNSQDVLGFLNAWNAGC